jgi:hypothetical protein
VTHLYSAYGLTLESQVAIPGLADTLPADELSGSSRISVVVDEPPTWLERLEPNPELVFPAEPTGRNTINALRLFSRNSGAIFHLTYPDGAQFAIDAETRKLWCWGPAALTLEDLATYIVGPVLGFILRRRGTLALHASCFRFREHAFALSGGPRSGKSTAAAALAMRGLPILCEDITALREQDGNFLVSPGYPRVNLWPDSAASLSGSPGDLPRITPNWEKQFLPLDGGKTSFERRPQPLAAVYIMAPREASDTAPRIERISPRHATLLLVQNTYMNYLLDKAQRAAEFNALVQLVSRVAVRRLVLRSELANLNAACDLIEADAAHVLMAQGVEQYAKPAS